MSPIREDEEIKGYLLKKAMMDECVKKKRRKGEFNLKVEPS